jgi:hypothetical protein
MHSIQEEAKPLHLQITRFRRENTGSQEAKTWMPQELASKSTALDWLSLAVNQPNLLQMCD